MANRLISEQSPYLQQHAHNPVNWYPWGEEAFEIARKEHKPVLVSIGYSACHWCHVMERESFENDTVAAFMNEHFVNIKVDREEHPDVDHMYMDAVQAIGGNGGWPLNVFVTPGKIPFYGGTYFPPKPMYSRSSWMQVLDRIRNVWVNQPEEISAQEQQMLNYLQQAAKPFTQAQKASWDADSCKQIAENLLKQADKEHGGFGQAPKFPGSFAINYLLEHYHFTGSQPALDHALHSLDAMIEGGIYDQLGGGFARYATDNQWLVPHFEKMLYDNALLIISMCDAYQLSKKPIYKRAVEETIAFIERELKYASGAYYSALDADSEGIEGKFYTWDWEEWVKITGNDDLLNRYFGVSHEGNWEHTNILHIYKDLSLLASETGISLADAERKITNAKQQLLLQRDTRKRPLTDDKSLLSWNALMNLALSKSALVFQEQKYMDTAIEHMHFMLTDFIDNDEMMHVWKLGRARIKANLDDYAYLISALLQLASVSGNTNYVTEAVKLLETVLKNFLHEDGTFFYYTSSDQPHIPVRKVDLYDGATPSANAIMAHNLFLCGISMERADLTEQAEAMLQQIAGSALRYSGSFGYWALMMQRYAAGLKLVVISGKEAETRLKELQQYYFPQAWVLTSKKEIFDIPVFLMKYSAAETRIFVCTEQACLPPSPNMKSVLPFLSPLK